MFGRRLTRLLVEMVHTWCEATDTASASAPCRLQ